VDEQLSNFGFNFNLRRYNLALAADTTVGALRSALQAGAYTRPLLGSS
jgi:hypothetical protein